MIFAEDIIQFAVKQNNGNDLSVLAVIAHPDDEILFGDLIHALMHQFNASVDLVCVTNGRGGFAYQDYLKKQLLEYICRVYVNRN